MAPTVTNLLRAAVVAVSWSSNRLDVFRIGAVNNDLQHTWWDGSAWGGWESLGGTVTSLPSVTAWAPNRLDVLLTGTDSGAWHKWYVQSLCPSS
jgi:hypothetical protein